MADSDDDEELKRAIALSLKDQSLVAEREVIEIDSDGEHDSKDLERRAEASTLRRGRGSQQPPSREHVNSLLGLNRKAMEEERLARKRKLTSISPPPSRKIPRSGGPQNTSLGAQRPYDTDHLASIRSSASANTTTKGLEFPRGVVKKTWVKGHPRRGDDIKIEEVLQKDDLLLAVLSSFQWDFDWLVPKLNARKTQMTFVVQAKGDLIKQQYLQDFAGIPNVRLCFPSMDGQVNCMHSKMMLLSHPNYLRVVVPTANLVPYDWGDTGTMENSVFLIDLPRLPEGSNTAQEDMPLFGQELIYFVTAMGLDPSIIKSILNFDFSATSDLAFVHTIGGPHTSVVNRPTSEATMGDKVKLGAWQRTGYCGLGRAVKELGLDSDQETSIDYITSSVGSLNYDFLSTLYLAAQGDDGTTELDRRLLLQSKSAKAAQSRLRSTAETEKAQLSQSIRSDFRIYFPTHETVSASAGGPNSAGTICFQSKWYNAPSFPKELLRDCKSERPGMLMHNKIIYVRHPQSDGMPNKDWAYVGSANCSESAWGKLVKGPKLNCRNWECGVVIPLRERVGRVNVEPDVLDRASNALSIFKGVVPLPMQYPGQDYGGSKPWFYGEH